MAYESEEELSLVVAAITCMRIQSKGRPDNVDFLSIPIEVAQTYGEVTVAKGDTPLLQANGMHRELRWEQSALDLLGQAIFEGRTHSSADKQVRRLGHADAVDMSLLVGDEVRLVLEERKRRRS